MGQGEAIGAAATLYAFGEERVEGRFSPVTYGAVPPAHVYLTRPREFRVTREGEVADTHTPRVTE
jgi:hypothetical protein